MDILTQVFSVFTKFAEWIKSTIPTLISLFYTAPASEGGTGSLTLLGVLAVCGLAMSVTFLLIGIIQRFLHFAG